MKTVAPVTSPPNAGSQYYTGTVPKQRLSS
jgi:hypothetical protein